MPVTTPNRNNMLQISSLNSSMVFNSKNMIERQNGMAFSNSYQAKDNLNAKIKPGFNQYGDQRAFDVFKP